MGLINHSLFFLGVSFSRIKSLEKEITAKKKHLPMTTNFHQREGRVSPEVNLYVGGNVGMNYLEIIYLWYSYRVTDSCHSRVTYK